MRTAKQLYHHIMHGPPVGPHLDQMVTAALRDFAISLPGLDHYDYELLKDIHLETCGVYGHFYGALPAADMLRSLDCSRASWYSRDKFRRAYAVYLERRIP